MPVDDGIKVSPIVIEHKKKLVPKKPLFTLWLAVCYPQLNFHDLHPYLLLSEFLFPTFLHNSRITYWRVTSCWLKSCALLVKIMS